MSVLRKMSVPISSIADSFHTVLKSKVNLSLPFPLSLETSNTMLPISHGHYNSDLNILFSSSNN